VIAGPDDRVPTASEVPGAAFAPPLTAASLPGLRVALSVDLGGAFEVDADVAAVIAAQADVLADAGRHVEQAHPDLDVAEDTFRTLRAWLFHHALGDLNARHPGVMKTSLVANIEAGAPLTGADVARAYAQRTELAERMRRFFSRYDVLALPVSQVPPFPPTRSIPPRSTAGCSPLSGLDALGLPDQRHRLPGGLRAGRLHRAGLPVGLQLVGPAGSERRLLEVALSYERLSGAGRRRPPL
jgi:amidase